MSDQKKRKWTIFFLVKSAKGSIEELIRMINEIRSIEQSSENAIILCLNVTKGNVAAIENGSIADITTGADSEEFTTIFYKLIPSKSPSFPNGLEVISINPEFDITKPTDLKVFFRNEILYFYEAVHYLLFTWDHGSAFGVFRDKVREGMMEPEKFLDIKEDEKEKILTMEELSNAIKWSFGNKKIDLLVMMNCYMQFFDAGYALRKTVRYLVAPETAISFDGYNYPFIFQVLADNPDISPKKLARHVVSSFLFKVYMAGVAGRGQKDVTAIFASRLKYYDTITTLINRLSARLIQLIEEDSGNKKKMLNAREDTILIRGKSLMDLFAFIHALENSDLLSKDYLLTSSLLSINKLVTVQSFIGNYYMESENKIPNGFTIFFPLFLPLPGAANENFINTQFYNGNIWKDFVKKCTS